MKNKGEIQLLKTIKSKLIFLVAILVSAIMFLGIYSIKNLSMVNEKSTIIAEHGIPGIIYSEELNTMTSDFRLIEYGHIIAANAETMEKTEKSMEEKNAEIQKYLDLYKKSINTKEDEELFNIVQKEWRQYIELGKKVIALSKQLKTEEAMKVMREDSDKTYEKVASSLLKLSQLNKKISENYSLEGDKEYEIGRAHV